MKAMILAAGLGTRLKPITDKIPKALVEVHGVPMLEHVILDMKSQGFNYIVVNVHHFADQIIRFLNERDYGVEIVISDESDGLLDTGGGIVKASPLMFKHDDNPVLIHNVDILSNADLRGLMIKADNETALLVNDRNSGRKLIFNKDYNLVGWHDLKNNIYRPEQFPALNLDDASNVELAFSGIYVFTKRCADEMKKLMGEKKFSVMDYFLNPYRKEIIRGIKINNLKLIDIGKPETLAQASTRGLV